MGTGPSKPAVDRANEFSTAGKELPPFLSKEDIYYHEPYEEHDLYTYREPFEHPKTSDDPLPELPIEIWQRIFVHLRRRVGPISGQRRRRGYFHQDYLFKAMRVCRQFYYLAAPILYARVVTNKPHELLYGAAKNSYSYPELNKRWTKLDLLQFIHRLDLRYTPYQVQDYDLRFTISLGDRDRFQETVLTYTSDYREINRMVMDVDNSQSATRRMDGVRTLRRQYLHSREPVIMSNLTHLTVSHASIRTRYLDTPGESQRKSIPTNEEWPRYTLFPLKLSRYNRRIDGKGNRYAMISSIEKRMQFGYEMARICTPKHICMDDTAGPYSYRRDQGMYDKIKTKPPETITLHLYPGGVDTFILPIVNGQALFRYRVQPYIFFGSTSRWVLDTHEWEISSEPKQKAELYKWLKWYISEFKKYFKPAEGIIPLANARSDQDEKTKIEIYGCLNMNILDMGLSILSAEGYLGFDINWSKEQKIAQLYDYLNIVPGSGEVILMDKDAGPCPACGQNSDEVVNYGYAIR